MTDRDIWSISTFLLFIYVARELDLYGWLVIEASTLLSR